jgi:phospholipase C
LTDYGLSVYGPNGFFREFTGGIAPSATRLDVQTSYDAQTNRITVTISNPSANSVTVNVLDRYTGQVTSDILAHGGSASRRSSLAHVDGWYDFQITAANDLGFSYEIAGHLETGKDSTTDPAMGGAI